MGLEKGIFLEFSGEIKEGRVGLNQIQDHVLRKKGLDVLPEGSMIHLPIAIQI